MVQFNSGDNCDRLVPVVVESTMFKRVCLVVFIGQCCEDPNCRGSPREHGGFVFIPSDTRPRPPSLPSSIPYSVSLISY